jgi:hypothetical protein
MINFSFGLRNPFSDRWDNIFNRSAVIDRMHKAVEVEVYRDTTIVSFAFRWNIRQDHAGMNIELGLFGYTVSAQYYDTRHWNEEAGRFYIYEKDGGSH